MSRIAAAPLDLMAINGELIAALKQCQSALAMLIDPAAVRSTTAIVAFAAVAAAEAKARATIGKATNR